MAGKAVILDYGILLGQNEEVTNELRVLMNNLRARGVKLVGFSTYRQNLNEELAAAGLPPVDLLVTRDQVGIPKGSPEWVEFAAGMLEIPRHHLFYVGDDEQDWRTAINSGILYLHASWSKPYPTTRITAFQTPNPTQTWTFLTHFFLPPARWEFRLDDPDRRLCVRALLNFEARLTASNRPSFSLKDVFTYDNNPRVGNQSARNLLMMHAIANLCAEGLLGSGTRFVVYPSSTPGQLNETFTDFLRPAAHLFHGWMLDNGVERTVQAHDTSRCRHEGRHDLATLSNQTNTTRVHPDAERMVAGNTVILFDDFHTSGTSQDWGRQLLYRAGAARVILVAFGKYPQHHSWTHCCSAPRAGLTINPFSVQACSDADFTQEVLNMQRSREGAAVTAEMFRRWAVGEPYPPA